MTTRSLANKLPMKPGQRALILHEPPEYLGKLAPLPERVEVFSSPEERQFDSLIFGQA